MSDDLSVINSLKNILAKYKLYRPLNISKYDVGTMLTYDVEPLNENNEGAFVRIKLEILKFVGGGFAGQVYKVRVGSIENGGIDGIVVGGTYAVKILIPPSKGSLFFRNFLYWIGFSGPFQLQSNPKAARSGALWQKFIRVGAGIEFGYKEAVNNVFATFVDKTLGSCGEISEWVEGRVWRLEVDEHVDLLNKWSKGKIVDETKLGSPEYRAKKTFMRKFVNLLHDMGAHEFARQYEWSTAKSQPNCLKKIDSKDESKSLVAVDFRAGLTLLPFLPMSPGDIMLIIKGVFRGSFVQFDRGNINKLESFIDKHNDKYANMSKMLKELKETDDIYRNSIPDITHNHIRLLYSIKLWKTITKSSVIGWYTKNIIDSEHKEAFLTSKISVLCFALLGFVPFLGRVVRKFWGHKAWRQHYIGLITSFGYLVRALKAKATESAIEWYRNDRISEKVALKIPDSLTTYFTHRVFSFLPIGIHKLFTDWNYAKNRFDYLFVRPIRLYFNNSEREQWLLDMVDEGKKKHILSEDDANVIVSKIKEPFIQKYLKSLAVHLCTVPVTQVVSVATALIYVYLHPSMSKAQAWATGAGIVALFQVVPISPGSLTRGLYVLYLVIKERNFKDYNIAVFLSFFKYVGYLAFPIQMTYRYPVLARFMAGHWATEAVHIVPVFGERGALFEHWVFRLFYNWPLTITGRMKRRAEIRTTVNKRFWHVPLYSVISAGIFGLITYLYDNKIGHIPTLKDIWWAVGIIPVVTGVVVTMSAGGTVLMKRISYAVVSGLFIALLGDLFIYINYSIDIKVAVVGFVWKIFIFSILSSLSAIVTEIVLPNPK